MNAWETKILYPWLVFNDKIKVNSVFLRDSTAVSDSVVLLFGGSLLKGDAVSVMRFFVGSCVYYIFLFIVSNCCLSFSCLMFYWNSTLFYQDNHLKMLGGYLEFFMEPSVAEMYQSIRRELDDFIQSKVSAD